MRRRSSAQGRSLSDPETPPRPSRIPPRLRAFGEQAILRARGGARWLYDALPEPGATPDPIPVNKRRGSAALLAGLLLAALFVFASFSLPLSRSLQPLQTPSLVILTSDGQAIARIGAVKGEPVDARKLPLQVKGAFIAIEDRRFYQHWGVDFRSLARAIVADIKARRYVQGGSTITQQLAKNSFLDGRRHIARKLQEALIAFWLELRLGKEEILSRYLSSAYFGDGVYGLRAAAAHYFGKQPQDLSLGEAAMLAGVVNAPSRLAPTHNLDLAQARARRVIAAMAETGTITPQQAASAVAAEPSDGAFDRPEGDYFADWVAPEARQAFGPSYGETQVYTTIDRRLQQDAERTIEAVLRNTGRRRGATQAALVAMRRDGSVLAMVGGRSYAASRFNRAVQARRQPGSAFKLFVYLAALRAGLDPDSKVENSPLQIGAWKPQNYEGRFGPPLTLREAFAQSSNVAAVRLSEKVGRGEVIRAARDLGVRSPLETGPTLPLGTSQLNLLELTSAYGAIAAGRYPITPHGLPGTKVPEGRRFVETRERWPLLQMLRAVVDHGTGRAAGLRSTQVYGKTGTTSDYRDAVFVGFAGDLVIGVWVGNDDNSPMDGVKGGELPAQIWREVAGRALATHRDLRVPGGLEARAPVEGGFWSRLMHFLGWDGGSKPAGHARRHR